MGFISDEAFLHWLRDMGAEIGSINWPIGSGEGRNVGAAAPLLPGSVLLRVPKRLHISADACLRVLGPWVRSTMPDLETGENDELLLSLFLLLQAATPASPWVPYLRVLPPPSDLLGLLPLWSPAEVATLADPTATKSAVLLARAWAHEFVATQAAIVRGCASDSADVRLLARSLSSVFSWRSLAWARGCVVSRAFLDGLAADELFCCEGTAGMLSLVLVPGADMFNHTPDEANACEAQWLQQPGEDGGGEYVLTSVAPCAVGEPLWISYGPHTDCDLLASYGFLPGAAVSTGLPFAKHFRVPASMSTALPLHGLLRSSVGDAAVLEAMGGGAEALASTCSSLSSSSSASEALVPSTSDSSFFNGTTGTGATLHLSFFLSSATSTTPNLLVQRRVVWEREGSPLVGELHFVASPAPPPSLQCGTRLDSSASASLAGHNSSLPPPSSSSPSSSLLYPLLPSSEQQQQHHETPPTDLMRVLRVCALREADVAALTPARMRREGTFDRPISATNELLSLKMLAAAVFEAAALPPQHQHRLSTAFTPATQGQSLPVPLGLDGSSLAASEHSCDTAETRFLAECAVAAARMRSAIVGDAVALALRWLSPQASSSVHSSGPAGDSANLTYSDTLAAAAAAVADTDAMDQSVTLSPPSSVIAVEATSGVAASLRRVLAARYRVQRRLILLSNLTYVMRMHALAAGTVASTPPSSNASTSPDSSCSQRTDAAPRVRKHASSSSSSLTAAAEADEAACVVDALHPLSALYSSVSSLLSALHFGLEVQVPWSSALLTGGKTVETRAYALPDDLIGQLIAIIEAPVGGLAAAAAAAAAVGDSVLGPVSGGAAISAALASTAAKFAALCGVVVGVVAFSGCRKYHSREQWEAEAHLHGVPISTTTADDGSPASAAFGWSDRCDKYAWDVASAVHLPGNVAVPIALNGTLARRLRSIMRLPAVGGSN